MAPDSPTKHDDCHPIAAASLLEAFAGADIGDVETDPAGGWTDRLALTAAVGWSGKA
jgi:hypothetical protein